MRRFLSRIAIRKIPLYFAAYVAILIALNLVLGLTGYSDKILRSVIDEQKRALAIQLAQSIRDPKQLEEVMGSKQKELEVIYGIDKPWIERLPQETWRAARLQFGDARVLRSFGGSSRISDIVLERLPYTLLMMLPAFLIVTVISVPVGAWLAMRAGSRLDRLFTFFSASSLSIPAWWLGIILILLFAVKLRILPSGGLYSTPPPEGTWLRFLDLLRHAILPVSTLVLVTIGPAIYLVRSITLRIAQEQYVTYARASGFNESRILRRYILRPAAPPITTQLGLSLAGAFGGAILTETVFKWPGMGLLYWEAISGTPDMGLAVALTVLESIIFLVIMFSLDILNAWLEPRIRLALAGR